MKNTMFRNSWLSPEKRVNQVSVIHVPQSTMHYHPLLEDAATATPDTNNLHPLEIVTVHNAKWRMDDFPQEELIEFRRHPAHVGMVVQGLDAREDFFIPTFDLFRQERR